MPKYQVELQNGKKYVVEADSMPTEDEVAAELQKNPDYMNGFSTPSDIFHKSAGENILGVVSGTAGRAVDLAKRIPAMIMDPMGDIKNTTVDKNGRVSGPNPLTTAGNFVKNTTTSLITEPGRISADIGTGTPEALGRALVDIPAYIGTVLGGKRLAGVGVGEFAQTAPVRAARSGVADVMRSASENSPELNAAASATGMHGTLGMTQKILGVIAGKVDPGPLRSVDRHMPNTSAGPSRPLPNAEVIPSEDARVQAMLDRYMPNVSADLPTPVPTPFASHLSASGADTNFGRTPGAGNAVYRQEGLPSELEQQMMDQERARAGENRGLTTAATERAMNVHTPGWHDVSLEEPATRLTRPNVPFEEVKFPAGMDTIRERYDYLSAKPVRSIPEERMWRLIDDQMHGTGATNRGVGYATRGKATGK